MPKTESDKGGGGLGYAGKKDTAMPSSQRPEGVPMGLPESPGEVSKIPRIK